MMATILVALVAVAWIACGFFGYKCAVAHFLREFPSLSFTTPSQGFQFKPERVWEVKRKQVWLIPLGMAFVVGNAIALGFHQGWSEPNEDELRQLAQQFWIRETPPTLRAYSDQAWLRVGGPPWSN